MEANRTLLDAHGFQDAQFLEGLGFPDDNPPNAAPVVETIPGETDIAVVELFNPLYDPTGLTVTYEVSVLENWEDSTELGFTAAPADLAALAASFGAAHLFIDGSSDRDIVWHLPERGQDVGVIPKTDDRGFCYSKKVRACLPCSPWHPYAFDAIIYLSLIHI